MAAPSVPQFPDRGRFVTPSDTDVFNPSMVLVYEEGDISVVTAVGDETLTFTVSAGAAEQGFVVPVRCRQVLATDTTVSQALAVS